MLCRQIPRFPRGQQVRRLLQPPPPRTCHCRAKPLHSLVHALFLLSVALTQATNMAAPAQQSVQTFGRKKTAVAVAFAKLSKSGNGVLKLNGIPLELVQPEALRHKVFEPLLLLGKARFSFLDIRIRVKGGGHVSQLYAIRQAVAKAIVAYHQKFVDEQTKRQIKEQLLQYDRTLLVADPRRCEPKKFGGRGARARFQKSYR